MSCQVGITRVAHHLPEGRMTVEQLAALTGGSAAAFTEATGLLEKCVARERESALDLALAAGRALMAGIDPTGIDMVIYATGSMPDYPMYWGIYKLHDALGLSHARLYELPFGCIASLQGLELARNFMGMDPSINRAVVIGAESYHWDPATADYTNPRNEPMFIFGDGAAAALLESDRVADLPNALGAFRYRVDSRHHTDVAIPAGGAHRPTTTETVALEEHKLQYPGKDPQALRRFGVQYLQHMLAVIRESLEASGHTGAPDFLVSNQLKAPLLRILLAKLGLTMDQTIYTLPQYGHVGTADILIALEIALADGTLQSGQRVAIAASGAGFAWGATTLEIC